MDADRHIVRRFKASRGNPRICPRGGRHRLAEVFGELGYKKGVEIGTRTGTYSKVLCDTIPGLFLSCIDPWVAYNRLNQEQQDAYCAKAYEVLQPYNVRIIKKTSMEGVKEFENNSLDFAFIDGSHDFDDAMMDIICWAHKVRPGGIVAGHDYSMFPDVVRAVHAYTGAHGIMPWYLAREFESTFFWVKK